MIERNSSCFKILRESFYSVNILFVYQLQLIHVNNVYQVFHQLNTTHNISNVGLSSCRTHQIISLK